MLVPRRASGLRRGRARFRRRWPARWRACRRGRHREAADILAGMERSSKLSDARREFCRRQEAICPSRLVRRGFAHLPSNSGGDGTRNRVAPLPPNSGGLVARPDPARRNGDADRGPRALMLACERLGVRASLPALRRPAGTGVSGTTLAGLKRAPEGLHLRAEGVQAGREALSKLPTPALAWVHGDHYVAVVALRGEGESGDRPLPRSIPAARTRSARTARRRSSPDCAPSAASDAPDWRLGWFITPEIHVSAGPYRERAIVPVGNALPSQPNRHVLAVCGRRRRGWSPNWIAT